jgi:hypothetical protein
MSKLSQEEVSLLQNLTQLTSIVTSSNLLELISGANGTLKLNGTGTYSAKSFKAVCFSEDSEVTSIADSDAGDRDTYFTDTTYTAKAGDILVPVDMIGGTRFTSIELASGSATIIF